MTLALFRRRRPASWRDKLSAPPSVPRLLPPPVAPEPLGWVVVATAPGGRPSLTHTTLMGHSEALAEMRQWRRQQGRYARDGWSYDVRPVGLP